MKSLIVILAGIVTTWFLTDVRSANGLFNLWMPLLCVAFVFAFLVWLVFTLARRRIDSRGQASAVDVFSGDGDGSDGGD